MELIRSDDFLNTIFGKVSRQEMESVINVIQEFIEGKNLMTAIRDNGLTYRKFRYILSNNAELAINFEDMIALHKDAFKEKTIEKLTELIDRGDFKAISFTLERMFPDDFGRKVEITNKHIEENPKILDKFVNAEYS